MNRISAEQTAQLWNDAGRPAPGGGLWSSKKIAVLLAMEPRLFPTAPLYPVLSDMCGDAPGEAGYRPGPAVRSGDCA